MCRAGDQAGGSLMRTWLLGYVSERSGVPLRLKVARTGLEHTGMVFARPKEDPGKGQIVVLESSPIHALDDLQGQEMIFPHTAAFLGYHLPMDALLRKGIKITGHFAGTQEGAMTQLKAGRVVAAGVNAEVMRAFAQRENIAYRVLWSSEKYLSLALSALPSVPAEKVKAVREV